MRKPMPLLIALVACGCNAQTPTQINRLPPPILSVDATTHVISVGGVAHLEVSASLRNETRIPIQVAVGAQCPLLVRLFWDPTGEYAGAVDPSMACAPGGPTIALGPSDTGVLTRRLSADTLASFVPGTYGVNVAVTTSTGLLGAWAGAVQLPLVSSR